MVLFCLLSCFRDLGLYVDSDLKLYTHSKHVISKALRVSGLLFKCLRSNSYSDFVTLFKIYVIPIITYCSGLYTNPSSRSFKKVESVQRLFTRRLYMRMHPNSHIPDYSSRLRKFGLSRLS